MYDLSVQMKKGLLDLCVLALVDRRERYGYELAELLAEKTNSSIGTIYPILRKMKDAGLLTAKISEDSGGPPRKYYYITPQGKAVYAREKQNWQQLNTAINSLIGG